VKGRQSLEWIESIWPGNPPLKTEVVIKNRILRKL
jgi:hypothetical protein